MAMDSIMASPINRVRLIVPASSGCWAMELRACAMALPSPRAGAIDPMAMHRAAATIDVLPISVTLFMFRSFLVELRLDSGGDIHRRQNGKDIGLNQAHQQPENLDDHWESARRGGPQDSSAPGLAH